MGSLSNPFNQVLTWLFAASNELDMLLELRAIVLAEVYLSGLSCDDSLLILTLRRESVGVEVVLDLLFLILSLIWSFSRRVEFRVDAMDFALVPNEFALASVERASFMLSACQTVDAAVASFYS